MKKFLSGKVIVGVLAVGVAMPLITGGLMCIHINRLDTTSAWIGFFGSYFGAIMSGIVTLYVLFVTTQQTLYIQKQNSKADVRRERIADEPQVVFCSSSQKLSTRDMIGKMGITTNVRRSLQEHHLTSSNDIGQSISLPMLTNIGKGHAKNIEVNFCSTSNSKEKLFKDNSVFKVLLTRGDDGLFEILARQDDFCMFDSIIITYEDICGEKYMTTYTVELLKNIRNEYEYEIVYRDMKFERI